MEDPTEEASKGAEARGGNAGDGTARRGRQPRPADGTGGPQPGEWLRLPVPGRPGRGAARCRPDGLSVVGGEATASTCAGRGVTSVSRYRPWWRASPGSGAGWPRRPRGRRDVPLHPPWPRRRGRTERRAGGHGSGVGWHTGRRHQTVMKDKNRCESSAEALSLAVCISAVTSTNHGRTSTCSANTISPTGSSACWPRLGSAAFRGFPRFLTFPHRF